MTKSMKWVAISFLIVVALTAFTLFVTLYRQNNVPIERVDYVLDTVVVQSVAGKNAAQAATEVSEYLREFERKSSAYLETSQVSQIRENAGKKPVTVDADLYDLISRCVELCERGDGVVDITIQPVSSLWDFKTENPTMPLEKDIVQALELVDYRTIVLDEDERSVYLPRQGQGIDLGAVAKGYLCQELTRIYQKHKVNYAVTTLGGNVLLYGKNEKVFTVGLRNPDEGEENILGLLTAENQVIATSGAYERNFEVDGVEYHHILDTNTGYPAQSDLKSVTVIGENGLLCDYLSTYFFIQGSQTVKEALSDPQFDVIAIDQENRIYLSDRIRSHFVLTDSAFTVVKGTER